MRSMHLLSALLLISSIYPVNASERWFTDKVANYGAGLFQQHCAVCHGANAEGTRDWKTTDANGVYPPPPLDGSAHAWHHSIPQLARSIKQGGQQYGGVMPPFADKLSDEQVLAVIAYFQSKWPDDLYQAWHERFLP